MMQLQQQQQQQKFDEQLRIFKEETARQSREAVETLRRENAQLLTEVQRLKERHVTPKSSRRPKTPIRGMDLDGDGVVTAAEVAEAARLKKEEDPLDASQRKELVALDFELEKCRRREQLLELRDRLDRESHEARQKREHDYWLEAQRRRIQALRVEKALQREVDTADVALDPYAPRKMPYDPSTGFGVVLDGFVGSEEYRRIRVVYAL